MCRVPLILCRVSFLGHTAKKWHMVNNCFAVYQPEDTWHFHKFVVCPCGGTWQIRPVPRTCDRAV